MCPKFELLDSYSAAEVHFHTIIDIEEPSTDVKPAHGYATNCKQKKTKERTASSTTNKGIKRPDGVKKDKMNPRNRVKVDGLSELAAVMVSKIAVKNQEMQLCSLSNLPDGEQ